MEQAVIIHAVNEEKGIDAEYAWFAQKFPRHDNGRQSLKFSGGKIYDVMEITTSEGVKKTVYFDITAFFGK